MCVVMLYPNLSRFKSRWKGFAFYGGISVGTLLVAALTGHDPALSDQEWSWVDWTVLGLGVGSGLAVVTRYWCWPSREEKGAASAVQEKGEKPVKGGKASFAKQKHSRSLKKREPN